MTDVAPARNISDAVYEAIVEWINQFVSAIFIGDSWETNPLKDRSFAVDIAAEAVNLVHSCVKYGVWDYRYLSSEKPRIDNPTIEDVYRRIWHSRTKSLEDAELEREVALFGKPDITQHAYAKWLRATRDYEIESLAALAIERVCYDQADKLRHIRKSDPVRHKTRERC